MRKVMMMSLEEFLKLPDKSSNNLERGDIVKSCEIEGKWKAYEVTEIIEGYGNGRAEFDGPYDIVIE